MIKLNSISQIEHGEYLFENAILNTDALNGDFGAVAGGEFSVGATAKQAIMQIETGDDVGMPEYKIKANEHVRVVDLEKLNGKTIEVYGAQLPETFVVGDKLASNAKGKLINGASNVPYLEVTKIVGNKIGIEATVVAE